MIVAAGIVLAHDISLRSQRGNLEKEAARGRVVLCTKLHRETAAHMITLPGEVHGYIETPIYAKIPGYLKTILVDKGDHVKKGQLLAVLVSPETDQQVANAQADLVYKELERKRYADLVGYDAGSQDQADAALSAYLISKATLRQLKATQAYEQIRAESDAIVTARYVDPGALIPQVTTPSATTPIIELATLSPLRVYVYLPQTYAPLVHDGDESIVTVSEYPSRDYKGSITRHPSALDQGTRTMLLEVDLANQDRSLYPGMYANVAITIKGSNGAPRVPDEALIFNRERVYVPIVQENRIHLIMVKLGLDDGINCEITRGLKGDETVALGLGQAATEGELIRPLMAQSN
jgi:RND family efflux transporter MFP subunit